MGQGPSQGPPTAEEKTRQMEGKGPSQVCGGQQPRLSPHSRLEESSTSKLDHRRQKTKSAQELRSIPRVPGDSAHGR